MLRSLWELCCSLKLAIYLASTITLLLMGGSLLIPSNSAIFGSLDTLPAASWMQQVGALHLSKTWWLYLTTILVLLFGLNTLCCFLDWLRQFATRWRKLGEYLLHLGVVLVLIAYFWGSSAGWRHPAMNFDIGKTTALPNWPGHYLRVDSFQPVSNPNGPPRDMISEVSLLRGDQLLVSSEVRINQPLFYQGIVVTPVSFGRQPAGFQAQLPGLSVATLVEGAQIKLAAGNILEILRFLPDAARQANGEIRYRTDRIGNPAFQLRLTSPGGRIWQGWYFVREPLPRQLRQQGLEIRLLTPVYDSYSTLTVNYDPGARLAAIGSGLMTIGVLLALFSFYRKRKLQDRPEI